MSDKKSKRKAEDEGVEANCSIKKKSIKQQDEEGDEVDDEDLELLLEDSDLDGEKAAEGQEEGGEEDEGEESDNEQFLNKEIQIEFSAYDTNERDFHGIKCLLQRLWLKENIDLSGLADLLIEENTIALALKQEDEADAEPAKDAEGDNDQDDVYGIMSLIPFNEHFSAKECIKQIKNLLLTRIPDDNTIHQKLNDSKSVCALVISERFINLPPKIAVPSYSGLMKDIKAYQPDNGKPSYKFDHVIMVSKIQKAKTKEAKQYGETIYVNAEEELFDEFADAFFEYSVADQCDPDSVRDWGNGVEDDDDELPLEPFRKVLLFSSAQWFQAIEAVKNELA